jgi:hypothetical protein
MEMMGGISSSELLNHVNIYTFGFNQVSKPNLDFFDSL